MKLLFTGPLLDFSGFAHASRHFLRTLLEDKELDVVVRPLRYDELDAGQKFEKPAWMVPLLEKDLQGIDMAIQMTTCNVEANPVPGIPNGLYTFFETDRIQAGWSQKANEFDFLIVPSRHNGQTLLNSGVKKPIMVAAPPCDKDVYEKERTPFEIQNAGDRTIFYNICQLSTKKGIDCLLRAYYAAFAGAPDDVLLVLKTYVSMQGRQNDIELVKQYIEGIKQRCRIPIQKFPPVLPIVYTMTDDEIHSLHVAGDAYVCSSRAEGWGLPVFDALSHGKTVISHASGGMADFVNKQNTLLYTAQPTLFYDMPHPDMGLFTGLEGCVEPCVPQLALVMQRYHTLRKTAASGGDMTEADAAEWASVLQRRDNGKIVGQHHDYRQVSEKIVHQLKSAYANWKENGELKFDASAVSTNEPSLEETV